MKRLFLILFVLISLFFSRTSLVKADVAIPTENTVYFTLNGEPYNKPVNFEISCYGYTFSPGKFEEKTPGTYTPENVYFWSASCLNYGCRINKSHYLNYRHIDYCDLYGTTDGQNFTIKNFGTSPEVNCEGGATRKCTLNFEIFLTQEKEPVFSPTSEPSPYLISSPTPTPTENPTPPPAETFGVKDIFERIICFIKSIFGKTC
ncbi:MAG TPA: hypothetical protein VMW29_01615 [Candidatus Bathyarchaeia archaeon]|nr:hypothetical protein [Candidatus Bathyarchaeia archaeon]